MRFLFTIPILFIFITNSCGQSQIDKALKKFNTGSVPYIHVEEVTSQDSILFLDARKRQEYEVSHLQNAIWVGHEGFNANNVQSQVPDKNSNIIIYCSVGVRSEQIGEKLLNLGYTRVKNLYGGIFEWKNKGYPIYDDKGRKTEKIHAFDEEWGKLLNNGDKVFTDG